ncbi:MAG: AraC family transcriptional regulator [Gammaproteobacteria bacterium]|uniref:AraC family transcriptional regulator n=1 Tax=Pseudomaricurvus alcaniphilus TaxID=1166482 RepID=UPI00140831CE|nr:AraC family transcriptional regulator [Pseudomaricurvus alcaniphilus]MBR9909507.1 AraC family transcriptional regulator [Gammaproteobacteria bacterium]NHN37079.1 AraC family transcriptional regulator [Pseudomaricurvus alcaniphilus]
MTSQIRTAVLNNYVELAQHLGLNPQPLLNQVGLSMAMVGQKDGRIPAESVIALLENSAAASGCPVFGLRMAESRQLSDFGAVSLLLLHQQTLRDALRMTMNYRHLLNEALVMYIEDAGKLVLIREELVTGTTQPARQATEFAIGVLFRLCRALLGTHWHPSSVNFTHNAPPDLQLHRRMFHCNIKFDAEFNGIVCPAADLDYPNPNADPAMAKYAEDFVASLPGSNRQSFAQEVRQAIYLLLPMGRASIEQIAQALGVNARTLQRRLEESDITFSDLINDVRRNLAVRYMANPNYSLAAIADMLGYSVASSFTRWFTSQFGAAPARWRAEHCKSVDRPSLKG